MFENAHTVYDWGLNVIRFVQSAQSPALTALMKAITFLASEVTVFTVVLVLFALLPRKKSFLIAYVLLFSAGLNLALKNTWCVLRPFKLDPSVMLTAVGDYSTPSGHAQASATFWLCVYFLVAERIAQKARASGAQTADAAQTAHTHTESASSANTRGQSGLFAHNNAARQKRVILAACICIIALIGFSRVYLGVHYPTDVLLGWVLGAATACTGFIVYKKGGAFLQKFPANTRVLAFAVPSFVLLAIYKQNPIIPGTLFGMGVGFVYATDRDLYDDAQGEKDRVPKARAVQRIVALLCLALPLGLGAYGVTRVLPPKSASYYRLTAFALFAVLGFWWSFGSAYLYNAVCKKSGTTGRRENAPDLATKADVAPCADAAPINDALSATQKAFEQNGTPNALHDASANKPDAFAAAFTEQSADDYEKTDRVAEQTLPDTDKNGGSNERNQTVGSGVASITANTNNAAENSAKTAPVAGSVGNDASANDTACTDETATASESADTPKNEESRHDA